MSYSAWADNFLSMMPMLITLAPRTGTTGSGTPSYGPAKSYHAYVTADSKAVYSATGTVVFSTSVIIAHPKATDSTILVSITPDAKLTLPDGTTPRILTIGSISDESGVVCWEIRT